MSGLDEVQEPSDLELWAIEAEEDLLAAELALVDAETVLLRRPGKSTAAAYLQALLDVVDLHDFTDHRAAGLSCPARHCGLADIEKVAG